MGAFNTITAPVACPNCGVVSEFEVQFKYGDVWQHHYRVGDPLRWGGNDVGQPGFQEVVVEGIGGPCPACGEKFLDFDVVMIADHTAEIRPTPTPRPATGAEGFVVVRK